MKKLLLLPVFLAFILLLSFFLTVFTPAGLKLFSKSTLFFEEYVSLESVEGSLADEFTLHGLSIRTETVDVNIDQFHFQWQPWKLFYRSLQIGDLFIKGVSLNFKESKAQQSSVSEQIVLPEFILPIGLIIKRCRLENVQFVDHFETWWKINYLDLSAHTEKSTYFIDSLIFDSPQARFELEGSIASTEDWPVAVRGTWQLTFEGYNEMGGDLSASGKLEKLEASISANRPVTLNVQGVLADLLNDASWVASIEHGEGSLMSIHEKWPDIFLENLKVKDATGDFGTYKGIISGDASYWRTQDVHLVVTLDGNEDGIVFSNIDVAFKESTGVVKGEIGWLDHFYWKGQAQVEGANPEDYIDLFPGSIDGEIVSEGEIGYEDDDVLSCYFDIHDLSGMISDHVVTGEGIVRLEDTDILFEGVHLKSDQSTIDVEGAFTEALDFSFNLASPDIQQFLPDSSGYLTASGILYGNVDTPYISFSIDGKKLQYQEQTIERIEGGGQVDFSPGGQIYGDVTAKNLVLGGVNIDKATLLSTGVIEDHQLLLQLDSELLNATARVSGGVFDKVWRTDITQLTLSFADFGNWSAQDPAELEVSEKQVNLDKLCLIHTSGTVCSSFDWSASGTWFGELDAEKFDLTYFIDCLSLPYDYKGTATTEIKMSGDINRLHSAEGHLNVYNAQLVLPKFDNEETRIVHWDENRLDLFLDSSNLEISLLSAFSDGSRINAEISGKDFAELNDKILQKNIGGAIDIEMKNADDLSFLTDYSVRVKGGMSADFILSGQLLEPEVEGKLLLEGSSIIIPAAGLTLEETDVEIEAGTRRVELAYSTRSGEGDLKGEGYVDYSSPEKISGYFTGKGQQFTAVNLPEYEFVVNSDVRFVFNNRIGKILGDIEISKALIAPAEIATAASESRDVVYVDELAEEDKKIVWPLITDLDITFGDDVLVDSFGLYGHLSGELDVTGEPGEDLTGYGQLTLDDGTFSIYGRVLDIERGRLFFTGGPIENPFLDVRAQRSVDSKVAGTGGGWTVGVDVSGTVDDMHFELFSSPVMDESDILAYMIVGHSEAGSNSEESGLLETAATAVGVGATAKMMKELSSVLPVDEMHMEGGSKTEDASIVVGKSLTKDLFIGYDYNFFKSTGEFLLRYDLGRGFFIETQSYAEGNGAELIYIFEN